MAYSSIEFTGTTWLIRDADIYVSRIGSDEFGVGDPQRPYTTIQKAVTMAVSGQKIVVGTGYYNEVVAGSSKNLTIQADGKVCMEHSGTGTAFSGMGTSSVIQGFSIKNYLNAVDGNLSYLSDCILLDSDLVNFGGNIVNCVFKDVLILATATTYLRNDTFIHTASGTAALNQNKFQEVYDCHFDSTSLFEFTSSVTTAFDYCNQQSGSIIKINGTNYASASAVHTAFSQYQASGISAEPSFNVPASLDYSLKENSPLLRAGRFGKFIGARGLGYSLNATNLSKSILTNVMIDAGTFKLINENRIGTIETPIIDLKKIRKIANVRFLSEMVFNSIADNQVVDFAGDGFQPNHLIYQIRYASFAKGINVARYQTMVWDKMPTFDNTKTGNGVKEFNFNSQKIIATRFIQLKIILRRVEAFMLVQENEDCLLQENGDNLLWKY